MYILIPLVIFFTIQMISQRFERKALSELSNDDKAKLLDCTSSLYFMQMIPLIGTLIGFGLFMLFDPSISLMRIGLVVYIIILALSSLYDQRKILRKLSEMGLPVEYVTHRKKLSIIQSVSIIIFFSFILGSALWSLKDIQS